MKIEGGLITFLGHHVHLSI